MKTLLIALIALLPFAAEATNRYPQIGESAWSSDNLAGTVAGVFPDGRISLKVGYSNYTYQRHQIALSSCINQGVCSGTTVFTRDNLSGRLNGTFPNGNVSITVGYSVYNYNYYDIAQGVCSRDLCPGARVTTNDNLSGTVNGFFPNGDVSIRVGYSNYVYAFQNVGGDRPSYPPYNPPYGDDIRVNDPVWTRDNLAGTVAGVFPNGNISVKVGYSLYNYVRRDIATRGCMGQVCSGEGVVTSDGLRGTVNGVFQDGNVSIRVGYSNYVYYYTQLARSR